MAAIIKGLNVKQINLLKYQESVNQTETEFLAKWIKPQYPK